MTRRRTPIALWEDVIVLVCMIALPMGLFSGLGWLGYEWFVR